MKKILMRLKRKVVVRDIRITCPIIATCVISAYNRQARLFIACGDEWWCYERWCSCYNYIEIRFIVVIRVVSTQNTKHVSYADGLHCPCKLQNLEIWWHKINKLGSKIGYILKENKSWLDVKPKQYDAAGNIYLKRPHWK